MSGAGLQHSQEGADDAADGPQLFGSAPVEGRGRRQEIAEQLERPVDQMHEHEGERYGRAGAEGRLGGR